MMGYGTSLKDLEVLLFDCQAAHSDPSRGDVLEIGWLKTRASALCPRGIPESGNGFSVSGKGNGPDNSIVTFLVERPGSKSLPEPIRKITGLENEDFRAAASPGKIWASLSASAQQTAAQNKMQQCPIVIHFARYEQPFLRCLHQTFSPDSEFPFLILCTHEIVRRLFPGLPRKGLRTVAGLFGCALPQWRRCRHHLLGTLHIWYHSVRFLAEKEGIINLGDLMDWLDASFPASQKNQAREFPMPRKEREALPHLPGVYRMYRPNGDLLYIGKASSLKNRVNSYFRQKSRHPEHVLDMLSQAGSLTHSVTGTALEAALRESDEIKALAPPFNIALRTSGEGPFFFSADLKSAAEKPDFRHRIGPLPAKKHILSLAGILDVINGERRAASSRILETALMSPAEYLPSEDIFVKGVEEFKTYYGNRLEKPATFRSLMKLGTFLWKERLEKMAERASEEKKGEEIGSGEEEAFILSSCPAESEKKKAGAAWDPRTVSKRLGRLVRVAACLVRRAKWYSLLTESCMTWQEQGNDQDKKNLLVFRNGRPHFKEPIAAGSRTPRPPGCRKSFLEKQKNFDIYTYDRMAIVTTEIRKILKDGRRVELNLGLKASLDPRRLDRFLRWI